MSDSFFVTTPIYYVNDVPHLGHAYTTIAADVLARHHRALGQRVLFLTGTDEHGQKIDKAAREQGLEPIQLADQVVERFRALWDRLGLTFDDFIRTTEPRHEQCVQRLWQRLARRGDIYLGDYEGWYCTGCEEYYTETALLEGGLCPIHKKPVERLQEKSYFFRMSKYSQPLLDHIAAHPEFIQPEIRRNEIVAFVREGLRDLSISRTSFRWGVPVPDDPDHIIYVWIDALTNYISALDWDGSDTGGQCFQDFWPAVHLIGKDILRFHAVYWPTVLLAAGLPLPRTIFAHGWWTVGGEKMSKSLRNAVEPHALVDAYGNDAVRYFLLREVPFGLDGDFSHPAIIGRINAELANDLGNLVRRSVAMTAKYTSGRVPAAAEARPLERELVATAERVARQTAEHLEACAFHKALVTLWELVRATNRYIDDAEPWALNKAGEDERLGTVLYHILESIRWVAVMVDPFMPDSAGRILEQLGLDPEPGQRSRARIAEWGGLPPGAQVQPAEALFPRIEPDRAEALIEQFDAAAAVDGATTEPEANVITIDDLEQIDLRVGLVREAQPVPKSNKLIVLQIDLGEEQPRQVVAGIGQAYAPQDLIGKRLLVVANLEPVELMGVESRGMLLAAGPGGKRVVLAEFGGDLPGGEPVH
jgi:methionyl-tRNA synthetase